MSKVRKVFTDVRTSNMGKIKPRLKKDCEDILQRTCPYISTAFSYMGMF
jgi:hypothetical protein